jgi:hypothetical protein
MYLGFIPASLDVVLERQRRDRPRRPRRQDLADRVREAERHRHTVGEDARVVINLSERQNVAQHDPDRHTPFADIDQERIRDFTAGYVRSLGT